MLIPIIFFTLLILLVVYLIVVFNRFKTLENAAEATLGQVRVALKKRLELLHQLLESIRSYASFEKDTLESEVDPKNCTTPLVKIFRQGGVQ